MVIVDKIDEHVISLDPTKHSFCFIANKSKDIGSKKVIISLRIYTGGTNSWDDLVMGEYPNHKDASNTMQKAAELLRQNAPSIDFAII